MRKSINLCCILLVMVNFAFAQGIVFEKGTWDEALAKAKQENKILFVDVYTSWCAPCKMVAKTVFPQEKVGNYYNQHFINYQLDGEKGNGPDVVKKYGVKAYPTFLFINGDGDMVYRFAGAKDVKGFLQEADKVTTCAKFGGWDKMEADYKAGNADPAFLWTYYDLVSDNQKPEVLNRYLKSLPDEKLFTVEVGKMMESGIKLYDYDLMKRMVEGRIKLGEQEEEFNFFFTFGLQMLMTRYLDESIAKGDSEWFEKLLDLKGKFKGFPQAEDPDINMVWGRGAFFASDDFLNLRFLCENGSNDELFRKSLENYMGKLIKEFPLDSVASGRSYTVNLIKENPGLAAMVGSGLMDGQKLIASHIIDFTDYYWRMMPSDKAMRERCAGWVNYACNLNPYNPGPSLKAAGLLCRLNHKKDAVRHLENVIEKQEHLQGDPQKLAAYQREIFEKTLMALKRELRDVKNDKE